MLPGAWTSAAIATIKRVFAVLSLVASGSVSLEAEEFGVFTYYVGDGEITITDYPFDAVGEVVIPAQIGGLPVTEIGVRAFQLPWVDPNRRPGRGHQVRP